MSSGLQPETASREQMEDAVAAYLSADPGFFLRHPELVARLDLRHGCDGAASLLEYQVDVLRREAGELRGQLATLLDNARHNEEVARRLHALVLDLLETDRLDELFTVLYQALESGFYSELTVLRIFGAPVAAQHRGLAEFVAPKVPLPEAFQPLFQRMTPRCGRPPRECLSLLFEDRAEEVGSACLLPFHAGRHPGVLAIASRSVERFHANMGTHYLRQLSDMLGRLVGLRL